MKFLSAQEVAKILGIHETTVRANAKNGRLGISHVRVGSLWKFPEDEVYEHMYGKNWKEMVKGVENEISGNTETGSDQI